jgi:hypothetical protein
MAVTIDTNWHYKGFRVITLENRYLKLDIIPELGATIYNLLYKPADRNLLWHNPRIGLRSVAIGNSYDNNFRGGWDELFPNDCAEVYRGESYPDHGELWCQAWNFEITETSSKACTLHLFVNGSVTPTRMEKWITLRYDEPKIYFRHKLTNLAQWPLEYLWKFHPALQVSQHHRLDLPARSVEAAVSIRNGRGASGQCYQWPFLQSDGETHDIRKVLPPEANVAEMHYATELDQGWCALTDTSSKLGFGLHFDKDLFSSVWLFMSYGGWRGLYTVILEPSTTVPATLQEAKQRGRLASVNGLSSLETESFCVIYEGLSAVSNISSQGLVEG